MPEPIKKVGKAIWNVSLYTLSIPERYLRGLTALTEGPTNSGSSIIPQKPLRFLKVSVHSAHPLIALSVSILIKDHSLHPAV